MENQIETERPEGRRMVLCIAKFPMPPSSNQIYEPIQKRFGGVGIRKSKVYKKYEGQVIQWLIANQSQIKEIRTFVQSITPHVIHVDAKFWMPKKEIVTADGKPKKNDTANRLKALHDVLSTLIIQIDDSYFWSGGFSKEALPDEDEAAESYVDIVLNLRTV